MSFSPFFSRVHSSVVLTQPQLTSDLEYINAIALDALAWKYYLFYCVFLGFEVIIVYFFIVETRYTPMEEIAKFFDGDTVDVADIANAEVKAKGLATTIEVTELGTTKGGGAKQVEVA